MRLVVLLFVCMMVISPSFSFASEEGRTENDVAVKTQPKIMVKNPDPWENFNRAMFRFNDTLDRHALRPVAKGYRNVTPHVVQKGITNFFVNLRSPIVMLNDVLQGKIKQSGKDTARFLINSTVGIAGFIDVAKHISLPANNEDFGQTLGVWGAKPGPYLVLPFMGSSSVRDSVGFTVDAFSHPRRYLMDSDVGLGLVVVEVVSDRAALLDAESIIQGDRYLFIRDLYLQRRDFLVHDGKVEDPFLDDDFDDFDDAEDDANAVDEPAKSLPSSAGNTDSTNQEGGDIDSEPTNQDVSP